MRNTLKKDERYVVITPEENKLTGALAPALKTEFILLNTEGFLNLICDLSKVLYCDSSGLSAFLVGDRLCNEKGGKFVLCGLSEEILKLVKLSQLDSILNITPTLQEAVDFVLMSELERDLR
jgi:anti-sigma B factor antagonist